MRFGGRVRSSSDSIGAVELRSHSNVRSDIRATSSVIRALDASLGSYGSTAQLSLCVLDTVYWSASSGGTLSITGSLVGGSVMYAWYSGIQLVHNTIIGSVYAELEPWGVEIASNIFMGNVSGEVSPDVPFHNNDFVVGYSLTGGVFIDNIEADPLFCGMTTGDFTLQECSPCVGAAHDGGDIGAFGIGCECSTPVEETSWGSIKALFRQPSN
jgi:hypothetical protein